MEGGTLVFIAMVAMLAACPGRETVPAAPVEVQPASSPPARAPAAGEDSPLTRVAGGDEDGIVDTADDCPDAPECVNGFDDEDGCPDPDNDQDGVLDVDDACPDQAGVIDGVHDDRGCP